MRVLPGTQLGKHFLIRIPNTRQKRVLKINDQWAGA
jgi:hypothetical protein